MNHAGIGYLSYNRIVLPIDLLRPLSISDGSRIVGLYYPVQEGPGYRDAFPAHDFMLTPVPVRYWPVIGRLLIRLRHANGTLARVAEWLRDRGVLILNAESSRSAHRFATWNLTIAFESLDGDNPFDPETSEHEGTMKAVEALIADLLREFDGDDVLFRDPRDAGLARPVEGFPVRTHSYFHHFLSGRDQRKIINRPFELYCSHYKLQCRNKDLSGILDQILGKSPERAPTCVIAEMDTRDFNIRVAVIPPQELERFYEVVIPYRRSGGRSTRGLIAEVSGDLSRRYKFWRVFNSTFQNGTDVEAGEVCFCLEDCDGSDKDRAQRRDELETIINGIRDRINGRGHDAIKMLPHSQVIPITPAGVRARLVGERMLLTGARYDVFISYGKRDGRRIATKIYEDLKNQGLSPHLDVDIEAGAPWQEELIAGIRESNEVAVICTRKSLERRWIAIEIGIALGLGKTVTPIICGRIEEHEIPDYLRRFKWINRRDDPGLRRYSEQVLQRGAQMRRF